MFKIFIVCLLLGAQLEAQKKVRNIYCLPSDCSLRELLRGRCVADTSFIYALPYEKGKKVLMVQGYATQFSHKNELALDFKMRTGTKICAARAGKVIATEDKFTKGGLKASYLPKGNHVVIEHEDGTIASYWHFAHKGVFVGKGDIVEQGQVIGLCGNTGYSAFPHLHFDVRYPRGAGEPKRFIATRFATSKGTRYLRTMKKYKH